jgi:hypothetical protein
MKVYLPISVAMSNCRAKAMLFIFVTTRDEEHACIATTPAGYRLYLSTDCRIQE